MTIVGVSLGFQSIAIDPLIYLLLVSDSSWAYYVTKTLEILTILGIMVIVFRMVKNKEVIQSSSNSSSSGLKSLKSSGV